MTQPEESSADGSLSRRGVLIGSVLGAALLSSLQQISPAYAAVVWGHPFTHPRSISYGWGPRGSSFHQGLDYPMNGTVRPSIHVVADGVVTGRGYHPNYGNFAEVRHSNGWSSLYAHMFSASHLAMNQSVLRGDNVGMMGDTGASVGDHLHIEIRQTPGATTSSVDPYPLIHNAPLAGTNSTPPEDDLTPEQDALLRHVVNLLQVQGQGFGYPQLASNKTDEVLTRLAVPGAGYDYLPALVNLVNDLHTKVNTLSTKIDAL